MFDFVLMSMAVWRLSRFIRRENGPFCFMVKTKDWVAKTFLNSKGTDEGTLSELITCNKCLSFWLGLAMTFAWYFMDSQTYPLHVWIILPWAVSAVAIGLDYTDAIYGVKHKVGKKEEEEFDNQNSCTKDSA